MAKVMRSEQSSFGFVPIVLVSVVIALTTAALVIGWIFSWIYLKEHQKGVVQGTLYSPPALVAKASSFRSQVSKAQDCSADYLPDLQG
jgi:hypothetical protein